MACSKYIWSVLSVNPSVLVLSQLLLLNSDDNDCNSDDAYGDNGRRSHVGKNSSKKFKSNHENNDHDNDRNKNNYENDDDDKNNYENDDAEVCIVMPLNFTDATSNTSNTDVNSSDTDPDDNSENQAGRIKSRLRNQMTNATLNDCMKISIDGPTMQDFDFDSAVKKWSRLKNRRIFSDNS